MAGMHADMLSGGSGIMTMTPGGGTPITPQTANGAIAGAGLQSHHGPICLVLLAVAILFFLDRAGFRFAVTAGRR